MTTTTATVPDTGLRLNIGAGSSVIPGFTPIDRKQGQEAFPLQYPDNSVEEIRASHVLEHVPPDKTQDAINEWARVLKPGGRLRVAVPDFEYWSRAYQSGRRDVAGHIMGGHVDPDDIHHNIFDTHTLAVLLMRAGLLCINSWKDAERLDCSSNEGSLNLEAYKPTEEVAEAGALRNIIAVMSVPRATFTDNAFCATQSCGTLGIPMIHQYGVNWGQRLECGFEDAIRNGAEWILAIDFDTVWDVPTLQRLCMILEANPDVDALAPVQCKREGDNVLMNGFTAKTWDELDSGGVHDIDMAHFGLTLIRTKALALVPKPWFHHVPDADGAWHDGRVDDDVAFWKKFVAAGNRACIAPRVSIGHLQMMVTWPDEFLRPVHQYVNDWRSKGRPANSRH